MCALVHRLFMHVAYCANVMIIVVFVVDVTVVVFIAITCSLFDSASLPFKFLNRLPGGCSGGEGTPPETLKCLTPNPYS